MDMKCWECGGTGHSWRECSTPRQGNDFPFNPNDQNQNQNAGQNLNGQREEKMMNKEESTSMGQLSPVGVSNGLEYYNHNP